MPSAPELRDRLRKVREIEVDRELIPKQAGQPHGDERVAREIGENLKGKAVEQEEQVDPWHSDKCRIAEPGGRLPKIVSHNHFKKKAEDQLFCRIVPIHARKALGRDLVHELVGFHDRAGHELREKGFEERHPHHEPSAFAFGFGRAEPVNPFSSRPVNIHHETDALEGEKRDPDRKRDLGEVKSPVRPPAIRQEGSDDQRGIFEKREDTEIGKDGKCEPPFAGMRACARLDQLEGDEGVDPCGRRQNHHQPRRVPGVEDVARNRQQTDLARHPPAARPWQEMVCPKRQEQKNQKCPRVEEH